MSVTHLSLSTLIVKNKIIWLCVKEKANGAARCATMFAYVLFKACPPLLPKTATLYPETGNFVVRNRQLCRRFRQQSCLFPDTELPFLAAGVDRPFGTVIKSLSAALASMQTL